VADQNLIGAISVNFAPQRIYPHDINTSMPDRRSMREARRQTVKRHSLWYLVQGGLMILAGILALIYPVVSSFNSSSGGGRSRAHASVARVLHG
jgi:hypothetical protein